MQFLKAFVSLLVLAASPAFAYYEVRLDEKVLAECLRAPAREAQQTAFDTESLKDIFAKYKEVAVPARHQAIFARLVKAHPEIAARQPQLRAYAGRGLNAHEADHGVIVVSNATWQSASPLSDDEFAAVIAHELAHLQTQDSRQVTCEMLALSGTPSLTLQQAVDAVAPEMMETASVLAQTMRQWHQNREMAADARGAQMLARAGFDPNGMVKLLTRLTPVSGAFSRGSHPENDRRIDNVTQAIKRMQTVATVSRR